MFGIAFRKQQQSEKRDQDDVTKLFFDSFSRRVQVVEHDFREFSNTIAQLKLVQEKGQVSDLVLLERLQRLESRVEEALEWIRKLADRTLATKSSASSVQVMQERSSWEVQVREQGPVDLVVSPSGQVGSIRSLTTPTEMTVLGFLAEQGAKSAPEIGRHVGRSREHTARLMKRLLDEGYVLRDQSRIPYRYSLSERVKQGMTKPVQLPSQKATVSQEAQEKKQRRPVGEVVSAEAAAPA